MNKFGVEILSPQGVVFKGEASSASFPTICGIITVLPGHTDFVTKLYNGEIVIKSLENVKKFAITGGFIEIANNNVNIITEFAVHSDVTNRQKIEQAIKLARDMKNKRKNFADLSSAIESELKKSVVELKSGLSLKRKKYS
jgi:F-type H+-transporting ATPase subunit epsilon